MHPDPPTVQELWTVGRLLNWTTESFRSSGLDEPRLSAEILLAHALGCDRIDLYTRFADVPDDTNRAAFRELVQKAGRHVPIAYLVGHKEFFSLDFEVTPDVLIPRPETETLVDHALQSCRKAAAAGPNGHSPLEILDLGTGCGCIIIAVLTHLPHARGTGTDISAAAIQVASRNAGRHNVADRITFAQADRLELPPDVIPQDGFDLLVSNPPYVAEADMHTLAPGVRQHEPAIALTPGGDGLDFFRTLAADGPALLQPRGMVMIEIGAGQGDRVKSVFRSQPRFSYMGSYRSPSDPHDRVMHFAKV